MATHNATPEEFGRVLIAMGDIATKLAPRIEQTALVTGLGQYKARIFNQGKDSAQNPIGRVPTSGKQKKFIGDYTATYYQQVRKRKGAGTKKNYNITGQHLRNPIQVGRAGDTNAMGFTTDLSAKIADGGEGQHKKRIFGLAEREIDTIVDVYVDGVVDLIVDAFNKLDTGQLK